MTDDERQPRQGPRSSQRLLDILEFLATTQVGASLSQISEHIRAPKSSVLALTRSLTAMDYLVRRGDHYFVGPAFLRLVQAVQTRQNAALVARSFLEKVSREVNETALLAILKPDTWEAIYSDCVEGVSALRYFAPAGEARPLYGCAAGRAILAFQQEDFIDEYMASVAFKSITPNTMINRTEISKRLQVIRNNGYEISMGEIVDGGASIAAPIFGLNDVAIGSLVIAGPDNRIAKNKEAFSGLVVKYANQISEKLSK